MKKKRTWIILTVAVLLCGGVVFAVTNLLPNSAGGQASANVKTDQVKQTTLAAVVESTGSVTAKADVPLSFGTAGTVARVNVRAGDRVKQGDVLAELDTTNLMLEVKQAEQTYLLQKANYDALATADPDSVTSAQAAVNSANAAYQAAVARYNTSNDKVTASCSDVDNAKTALDDAQTAADNYRSNWRVQVYGSYEVSPQKAVLERAQAAYDQSVAECNTTKGTINASQVQSAQAELVQAKANLADLTSPNADKLAAAKAQVEQARLTWEQAQARLDDTRIVAPFDGHVTQLNVIAGEAGNTSTTIEVVDISSYSLEVLIAETEIGKVLIDQPVEATFDALPKTTIPGKVTRIDPAGTVNQGVINYKVWINLDRTEAALRIDMTGNVRIIYSTHENVLAVPTAAIRTDAATGQSYVEVLNLSQQQSANDQNSSSQRVPVTTGMTDGDWTEVSGLLQAGHPIVISEPISSPQ
jgi:HlyD family secretion protein